MLGQPCTRCHSICKKGTRQKECTGLEQPTIPMLRHRRVYFTWLRYRIARVQWQCSQDDVKQASLGRIKEMIEVTIHVPSAMRT